ncbi:MAG: methionyl-tRNA formyltransferase [Dongiaceae bacterium]
MTRRIVFMGTPDFALPVLQELYNCTLYHFAAIYTQPPRPAGRGQELQRTPVHEWALAHDIPVKHPPSLKDSKAQEELRALKPEVIVVVAYGLILPRAVLEIPPKGCLNIHASLLPRWRGAAPIQRAILAGDQKTGVSIMLMDEGLDTGPVLAERAVDILPGDTAGLLHDKLAKMGGELLLVTLSKWLNDKIAPQMQPAAGVSYADKINPAEALINWKDDAAAIERQVRAFNPWPGAYFTYRGERIKIFAAEVIPDSHHAPPGKILSDDLMIACGHNTLRPIQLQRAGKKPMKREEFLRGLSIPAGIVLD